MGQIVIARDLIALEANIAALAGTSIEAVGSISFDETSALEQTVLTIEISAKVTVGGIWLDMANVTQDTTIGVYHRIDGTHYRKFQNNIWTTVDDDGVLIDGFVAYRNVRVTLTCDGGGAGSVSIPYVVV